MTEADWLACTNPERMLEFLRGKASDADLRLFMAACCRTIWDQLWSKRSRGAVEAAEAYADGQIEWKSLLASGKSAGNVALTEGWRPEVTAARCAALSDPLLGALNVSRAVVQVRGEKARFPVQCAVLRDIFGPFLFREVIVDSCWLRWDDSTVVKIAQSIYDARDFSLMPILADALEDAGCDNADILAHCRQPGEHVRGCWVIDLLLGKQ